MTHPNAYEDTILATAYAKLAFPPTYYLAYRDLPEILSKHIEGNQVIDFGCGTGRSTRFLNNHNYNVTGVDISKDMITRAKEIDPKGNYHLIEDGNFENFPKKHYDLIISLFAFDNIAGFKRRVWLLKQMKSLLNETGKIILLDATPEIYTNEWESFSSKDFPENRFAKSGDPVKVIITALEDRRPIEDIMWNDEDYQETFKHAGLKLIATYKPLAKDEPFNWKSESYIPPFAIYVVALP